MVYNVEYIPVPALTCPPPPGSVWLPGGLSHHLCMISILTIIFVSNDIVGGVLTIFCINYNCVNLVDFVYSCKHMQLQKADVSQFSLLH